MGGCFDLKPELGKSGFRIAKGGAFEDGMETWSSLWIGPKKPEHIISSSSSCRIIPEYLWFQAGNYLEQGLSGT